MKQASLGLTAVAMLCTAVPAHAQWDGFYAGANGGWAWSSSSVAQTPFGTTAIGDITPTHLNPSLGGGIFGGQLGYNMQFDEFVVGVEGDFDGATSTGNSQAIFPSLAGIPSSTDAFAANQKINWLTTARGRLGVSTGSGLAYITGGAAWENRTTAAIISADTAVATYAQSGTGKFTQTRTGYVLGAGYEWMFAPGWSLRAEYLFYDFSDSSFARLPIPGCAAGPCGVDLKIGDNEVNEFRLGVNYFFNDVGSQEAWQDGIVTQWDRFYIGGNAGWAWSSATVSERPFGAAAIADITPASLNPSLGGGLFGGQIGYNMPFDEFFVGIEGDFDGGSSTGNSQIIFPSLAGFTGSTDAFAVNEKIDWLASARARLGTTAGPGLAYVTGGVAWENRTTAAIISANTAIDVFSQSGTGAFTQTRTGYVVGAGYEWMLAPDWSVRAEYLFYDFNGNSYPQLPIAGCSTAPCGVNMKVSQGNVNVFRIGVNYFFND